MQVILMERIENLGVIGDIVDVKSGFARNFLVPQKKAKVATKTNVADFEHIRADLEKAAAKRTKEAEDRLLPFKGLELEIETRAGQGGKLFGSVSLHEIIKACADKDIEVKASEIRMPEGPIRRIGDYQILIHLQNDVETEIKVAVVPDADSDIEEVEKQAIGTFVDEDDEL